MPGVNVISDQDMWDLVGGNNWPDVFKANWTRQQVFKLNLDKICRHRVLCVDAEVRWLRPFRAITNPQTWYTCASLGRNSYTEMITALLGIEDFYHESFITDCMLFDPEHLQQIRSHIELRHQKPWLAVINDFFQKPGFALSEYELYAAWCRYQQHDMHIVNIGDQRFTLGKIGPDDEFLYQRARQHTDRPYISIAYPNTSWRGSETRWLTFYHQVKGPDWPEAVLEEDFDTLPEWVKRECMEHGYRRH
jgi:hypothetical protein